MATMTMREQLYRQLDKLPDDVVAQIADFTLFVMAKSRSLPTTRNGVMVSGNISGLNNFFVKTMKSHTP